ncbi:hypothetical protein QCA50_020805 [Cerrena zonata]
MPVIVSSAHRIHSIHGSFGGPSFSSLIPAATATAAQVSSFNSIPNVSYNRAAGLSILSSRTSSPLSFTTSSGAGASNGNASLFIPRARARSSSIVPPMSSRRAPPPPPKVRTSIASEEDPFADMYSATDCVIVSLPPPRRTARSQIPAGTQPRVPPPSVTSMLAMDSTPVTVSIPMAPPPPVVRSNDQRAAKLVANVLLNRAGGRPMRGRPLRCGERTYVKSCLSRMVEVEA